MQDQLERTFLQLLQHPLKLICTPVQVTLAECYVAMIEWGDSRKTLDAVHSLVKVAVSRADVGNRVYVVATAPPHTCRRRVWCTPSHRHVLVCQSY